MSLRSPSAAQDRHRVLVLADSCNPEWPSLPVVGFKAALALAEKADVTVATSVRNRENIEKHGFGKARVVYIDHEYVAQKIHKFSSWIRGSEGGWTTAMALAYPSYLAFEYEVFKLFRSQLEGGYFDIVHRITPMSPTLPSLIASRIPNVPFVLGPLNGGLRWPKEFREELRKEREWLAILRESHKFLPYHASTFKNSAAILAGFRHTIERLPIQNEENVINFPEVGFDPELFKFAERPSVAGPLTILSAGRLVPYKLPDTIIHAYVNTPSLHTHRLVVAGDGPMRADLEAVVNRAGLSEQVTFTGNVTQNEVGRLMQQAHVFAFPSIRELGAGVLVEAMATGLACVVVNYGAPGALVDNHRGVVLPLGNKEAIIAGLGTSLARLVSDPSKVLQLGREASRHVFQFYTWEAKAQKTIEVYNWVMGRGAKPIFWE